MQIAFLSDIHANIVAFEAVLRDLDRVKPDQVVFLGDASTLGPQPRAVMKQLRALNPPCVMGNHDGFVLDRTTAPDLEWTSRWFAEQHTPGDLDFLRTFKPTLEIEVDGKTRLYAYHGSPLSNTDQILPTTPAERLDQLVPGPAGHIFIGGHTHIQMAKQYRGRTIVNAGSVGMPFEYVPFSPKDGPRLLPWAEYAILQWRGPDASVELRRVHYDLHELKQSYARSEMPEGMYWWSLWLPPEV